MKLCVVLTASDSQYIKYVSFAKFAEIVETNFKQKL